MQAVMSKLTTTVLFLSVFQVFTSVLARPSAGAIRFRERSANQTISKRQVAPYNTIDFYQGQAFFDQFYPYTAEDPTHGLVNYLDMNVAKDKGLISAQGERLIMKVDDTTWLNGGAKRDSVRIVSKKKYSGGLFILDLNKMPHGNSVWPAFWLVGPGWPAGGEIDILEGVHDQEVNQYTLHTNPGCSISDSSRSKMTGQIAHAECQVSGSDNTGCGIRDTDGRSYGKGLNDARGGVFATLWSWDGIQIWHWARDEIPQDIQAKQPDPSSWGKPAAVFSSESCNMNLFYEHEIVINTTLCGDWAGNTFPGGMEACNEYVRDPSHFKDAVWDINYVAVYSRDGGAAPHLP